MGKNKKTETIVAVLIPVLVFLLMAALTVVLWDSHNPSGARSAGASTEAGIVQPGTAILVIETRSQKDTEAGDTGEKTQEEPQNTQ